MMATREGFISTRDLGYKRGMDKYKRWWLQERDEKVQEIWATREGWISTKDGGYERGIDK
jgi:hypothetical protein